jgi:GNAT superfamily N-acetyltransferase
VALREVRVSGSDAVALATELLHRARLADPTAGLWEAADMHWWWRKPRRSDHVEQLFWLDQDGPVAAVLFTDWDRTWGCDPILLPGLGPALSDVWRHALDIVERMQLPSVEVGVRDDDTEMVSLLTAAGFAPTDEQSGIAWMRPQDRPVGSAAPDGFRLVDRADGAGRPHPMRTRNGDDIEERLRQCSLYDPELDLAVETDDGDLAAYALFWNDAVTGVGLLEPMRTEDAYQRRGIARMLLAAGLDRLAGRGAQRLKVGYATEVARHLYTSAGFRVDVTTCAYQRT